MSSRVVRAGIVVFALGAATALGCSIIVDFDETKIPSETDGGADSTAETSTTDTGTDTGTPTDTNTDSGADSGVDATDSGSDATDSGADATDSGADTTVTDSGADTTTTDTATADTADSAAADTADSATADTADSASSDTSDGATDAASDATDAASDGASDAASDSSGDTADGGAGTTFTAAIDGTQIIDFTAGTAGTASTATGKAVCVLNAAETALDCTVTHTVTSATVLQLREAFGGLNGTSVLAFDAATSPQTKSFTMTSGLVTSLKTGKLYAHIDSSTTTFPTGEVRGQLLKPGQKLYTATPLKGANQFPPVASTVTGGVGCILDGLTLTCNGAANTFGTDTPSAAHIHDGAAGTNGSPVVNFTLGTLAADSVTGTATGTVGTELDGTKLGASTSVAASQYYVNLHTASFAGGAARAQIVLRMIAPAP